MKRILLVLAVLIGSAVAAEAQYRPQPTILVTVAPTTCLPATLYVNTTTKIMYSKQTSSSTCQVLGGGGLAISTVGTTTTVLHGNVTGTASFGAVTINDVSAANGIGAFVFEQGAVLTTPKVMNTIDLGFALFNTGVLRLFNSASLFPVTIRAGNTAAGSNDYTWPTVVGAANSVLTDAAGNGTLSWGAPSACATCVTSAAALAANSLVIGSGGQAAAATTTGTGVLAALGINVGSAGAPVLFNGAGGTPSSMVGTNITGLPLAGLASQATNTVVGNATSGSAAPTALAVGTCSTASSALKWTTNTGFGCNTSITAAAAPVSGLTGAGTGVLAALAINVGSAGAPVLFNGALGSPSSAGTLPAFVLGGAISTASNANITLTPNGTGVISTGKALVQPNNALSDNGSTIATDASLGNNYRVAALTANVTLSNPTNSTDGQVATWEVIQNASAAKTLSFGTNFAFGAEITACTISATLSSHNFITAIYNSTATKWYVRGCVTGY